VAVRPASCPAQRLARLRGGADRIVSSSLLRRDRRKLADSQFRVVTGLAGPGTVSLESANFPGYYLRHKNNEVWVEKNDGSTIFKNDASFYQRAGLADSAGVSFESLNFPGRYIRHYEYLLYTQPADTTTAKADATFYAE
jgi:hypothetical protein